MKKMDLPSEGLHITEGVAGVYSYHLSEVETNSRSLCGAQTMSTQIPIASWGVRGHLNEKWCVKCATMGVNALRTAGVEPATN